MAIYPGARARLISPGSNDPQIIPIGVILHVDAGNSGSLYSYFANKSGGIESHFHIRKDGGVEQYRDTTYEADANYKGNSFRKNGRTYGFISVETQGLEMEEWNENQLREIKELLLWAHRIHGIPLRVCPAWDEAGIGYHIMFGSPGAWTNVSKSCPGPKRIKQFNSILVPWMKTALMKPDPVQPPVEDDMPFTEAQIRALVQAELEEYGSRLWGAESGTAATFVRQTKAQLAELDTKLDQIIARLPVQDTTNG